MSILKNEMLGGHFCLMEACKFTIKIFDDYFGVINELIV